MRIQWIWLVYRLFPCVFVFAINRNRSIKTARCECIKIHTKKSQRWKKFHRVVFASAAANKNTVSVKQYRYISSRVLFKKVWINFVTIEKTIVYFIILPYILLLSLYVNDVVSPQPYALESNRTISRLDLFTS